MYLFLLPSDYSACHDRSLGIHCQTKWVSLSLSPKCLLSPLSRPEIFISQHIDKELSRHTISFFLPLIRHPLLLVRGGLKSPSCPTNNKSLSPKSHGTVDHLWHANVPQHSGWNSLIFLSFHILTQTQGGLYLVYNTIHISASQLVDERCARKGKCVVS